MLKITKIMPVMLLSCFFMNPIRAMESYEKSVVRKYRDAQLTDLSPTGQLIYLCVNSVKESKQNSMCIQDSIFSKIYMKNNLGIDFDLDTFSFFEKNHLKKDEKLIKTLTPFAQNLLKALHITNEHCKTEEHLSFNLEYKYKNERIQFVDAITDGLNEIVQKINLREADCRGDCQVIMYQKLRDLIIQYTPGNSPIKEVFVNKSLPPDYTPTR